MSSFGQNYIMNKIASAQPDQAVGDQVMRTLSSISKGAFAATAATYGVKRIIRKIQNDHRRKAIIEDLMQTDHIIKEADKDQVLEYYAMIYNIAPDLSLEKPVVRELLQNFVKFGRVDMATVKMLTESQSKMKGSDTFSPQDMLRL